MYKRIEKGKKRDRSGRTSPKDACPLCGGPKNKDRTKCQTCARTELRRWMGSYRKAVKRNPALLED